LKNNLKQKFRKNLLVYIDSFNSIVSTKNGDWVIKGFIDVAKNIYTISVDTKVISKIMELLLFPKICEFARSYNYKIILTEKQNFYPDVTFIDVNGNKYALDLKSTYRRSNKRANGMTLGAFTGYFRHRTSTKNITFPYNDYIGHFVLGIIYSRTGENINERIVYGIDDLQSIASVIKDISFFVQEKYKIARDCPGSGNTKNIGSVTSVDKLINGTGHFNELGEDFFNDYWMYYMTMDMARAAELANPPYRNISEYKKYRNIR